MAAEIRVDRVQIPQRLLGLVPIPKLPMHDREAQARKNRV